MTHNDGYGNANVTFNHKSGTPEQDGNSGRIEVNTDTSGGASMYFELGDSVTNGVATSLTKALTLKTNKVIVEQDLTVSGTINTGQGDNELYAMDQDVRTSDDVTFGSLTIGNILIDESNHRAGLIETHRDGGSGYAGYSIDFDGQFYTLMSNDTLFGIYDDSTSWWGLQFKDDGVVNLRYQGTKKIQTDSAGIIVYGSVTTSSEGNSNQWNQGYEARPIGLSFNTSNGILTLDRGVVSDLTVDLDGRYLTSFSESDTLQDVTGRGASTSVNVDFTGSEGIRVQRGVTGLYDVSTGNWGSNIWAMGRSFNSSGDGDTFVLGNHYGLVWLRTGQAAYNSNVGEGLYIYQAGTLRGGMGVNGIYTQNHKTSTEWEIAYDDKINSGSFNTSNGVVTLNRQDGGTVTFDLDGRYLTSATNNYVSGLSWNSGTGVLTASRSGLSDLTIDLDGRYLTSADNNYVTSGSFNDSNGIVSLNRSGLSQVTFSLDGRYAKIGDAEVRPETRYFTFSNVGTETMKATISVSENGVYRLSGMVYVENTANGVLQVHCGTGGGGENAASITSQRLPTNTTLSFADDVISGEHTAIPFDFIVRMDAGTNHNYLWFTVISNKGDVLDSVFEEDSGVALCRSYVLVEAINEYIP